MREQESQQNESGHLDIFMEGQTNGQESSVGTDHVSSPGIVTVHV
jgi:hypothetical protein